MKKSKLMTKDERAFQVAAVIVLGVLSLCAILPFVLIFIASFTEEKTLTQYGYTFFPRKLSLDAYKYLANNFATIGRAYLTSICLIAVGTALSMLLTTMFAYPLSRSDFKYRYPFAFFLFFTMLFHGGIVPSYMVWTRIFHVVDSYLALLLPNLLMGAFNVLLVRNYYQTNVPAAIIESAQIDGANELTIFWKIMLPLAVPVNVTVGLFAGLAYWNDWTNALYYIRNVKFYGIQNVLMSIMNNIAFLSSGQASQVVDTSQITIPSVGMRMALAVIGVLPILILFPLLQKHLIKGIVVGAVKG